MLTSNRCKICKGTGLEKVGRIVCGNCNGKGCMKCHGNLYIQREYEECRKCWGSGKIKNPITENYVIIK